jgi:hypothetical protein
VLGSLHDSFPSLDHDNRSSHVVPQIEVTGTRQNTSVSVNMILALAPSTVRGQDQSLLDLYDSFPASGHDNISSHSIVPRKGVTAQNTSDSVNDDLAHSCDRGQDKSVLDLS